jgi:hypothetical protein
LTRGERAQEERKGLAVALKKRGDVAPEVVQRLEGQNETAVRTRRGWLSALGVPHSKLVLYGGFCMGARGA